MIASTPSLTGVVPAVCDAEAGQQYRVKYERPQVHITRADESAMKSPNEAVLVEFAPADETLSKQAFSVRNRIGSEAPGKP